MQRCDRADELLWQAYDRRQRFFVGLDNDAAGERGWQKAWDDTVDWTGFKISSDCPHLKDWNADLLASVQAVRIAKALDKKFPNIEPGPPELGKQVAEEVWRVLLGGKV